MKETLIVENKEVKSNGNTGRVLVPKRYLGRRVNVYLIEEEENNEKIKAEE
jgi:putative transposon-encoded protein